MALQLITGVSGSGKSTYLFDSVSAMAADKNQPVFVLVPDQFSQEAERLLTEQNNGGILNIQVLSFRRLAYRALEEYRGHSRAVLTDEGKIMLLRRVIGEHKNELTYFTKGLDRPGFLDECKSLLSEFTEYGVGEETFEQLEELFGEESRSGSKIRDLHLLYRCMEERMGDTYRMAEELIPLLTELVPTVSFLEDSIVCLDGFTGFTPVQYDLITALMKRCRQVLVTVTTDRNDARAEVFSLSSHTVKKLIRLASESGVTVNEIITTGTEGACGSFRLKDNPELDFLEQFIFNYDKHVYKNKTNSNEKITPVSSVRIRACHNEKDEAAFAAEEAARLIGEGVDPASIAVVTGNPDRYEPYLRRSFEARSVPYFIDRKKSLGMNPLAVFVLSFLSMCRQGFDVPGVMRFLRCGVSPVESFDEADLFENYLLATGRRGFNAYTKEWTYDPAPGRIDLAIVNKTRETFVASIADTVTGLRGSNRPLRDYAEMLCQLLLRTRVPEKLEKLRDRFEEQGETLSAREYDKLYPAFLKLLDTMVELLGTEVVSLREFEELLRAGLGEGVLGFAPPVSHPVLIGDIERTRLGEVEYLFFLGNTDSIFSGGGSSVGLLTDRERARIGEAGIELAPSAEELRVREWFYLYRLITRPTKTLILTFPHINADGEGERPSYLIERITALYGEGLSIEEDKRTRVPVFFSNKTLPVNKHGAMLRPETAEGLYGDELAASVSRFESYVKCPYAHFLNYGLRLRERVEYTIESNDRGTVFHDAIKQLAEQLHESGQPINTIDEEVLRTQGEAAFDAVVGGYRDDLFHSDKRKEYAMKRMKRTFLDTLDAMRVQMSTGGFFQEGWEVGFPERASEPSSIPAPEPQILPNGKRISLQGRIDRYDSWETDAKRYIKLVDYKSSDTDLSLAGVYYGLQMQLMTYMYVLLSHEKNKTNKEVSPAAVFYQKLDEGETAMKTSEPDAEKLLHDKLRDFRPKGYIQLDERLIPGLDPSLPEGNHTSDVVRLRTKTDGGFYPDSLKRLLTDEQFEKLMTRTQENIRNCGQEMYEGHIEAAPFRWSDESGDDCTGCTYCKYAGVCGVEARMREEVSHVRDNIKDEEVFHGMDD